MMDINGASVAPIDPSRLPYNSVGFPIPAFAVFVAAGVALVAILNQIFLGMPGLIAGVLCVPLALIAVAYFLFVAVRCGVHAALRMNAHDTAIDDLIVHHATSASRGHLSPERVARVTQGEPE